MRQDEFNRNTIRNSNKKVADFEFGNTQNTEFTFYRDNKIKIRDEINDNKSSNHENFIKKEDKKDETLREELSKESSSSETAGESSGSEAASSGSSASASSSSAAASGGAATAATATAATVGAVVIAVPGIIAAAFATRIVNHVFTPYDTQIAYQVEVAKDEKDERSLCAYLSLIQEDNSLLHYYSEPLSDGFNSGSFTYLESNTEYMISVLAYEEPNYDEIEQQEESEPFDPFVSGELLLQEKVRTVSSKEALISYIAITGTDYKMTYYVGDELDLTGIEVTAYYLNGIYQEEIIDNELLTFDYDFSEVGSTTVNISYAGHETYYNVDVIERPENVPDYLSITNDVREYAINATIDPDTLVVVAHYLDGEEVVVGSGEYTLYYDFSSAGEKEVMVTYQGVTESFFVNVVGKEIARIEVTSENHQTEYFVKDDLNKSGLEVTAYYTSDAYNPEIISVGYLSFSVGTFNEVGEQEVVITYEEVETSYMVNVKSHVEATYDYSIDFATGVGTVEITSIESTDVVSVFVKVDDTNYYLTKEVGEQTFSLPEEFDYEATHTVSLGYCYVSVYSEVLFETKENVTFTDSHVPYSEMNGFTLSSVIDYNPGASSYIGTECVSYTIDYVDELESFSEFHLTLASSGNDFVYDYNLEPYTEGKGLINLMGDELNGNQMSYDILQNETFSVTFTYVDSRLGSDPQSISCDPVTFSTSEVTQASVEIPGTYTLSDSDIVYPMVINYSDFDEKGLYGFKLQLMPEQGYEDENIVESDILIPEASGETCNFSVNRDLLESQDINQECPFIKVVAVYYDRPIVLQYGTFEFVDGQNVFPEGTSLSNNTKFEDNLVYVTLAYSDTGDHYEDFRLTLAYDETFEETTHYSFDFALEKTLTQQAVDTSNPISGGDTFELRSTPYDYEISCYDNSTESRITIKSGKIMFDTVFIEFGQYYSKTNKTFETTVTHTTSNTFNKWMLELTNDYDSGQTYTFDLNNTVDSQQVDVTAAESYTGSEWDMTNRFSYRLLAEQLLVDSGDETETVEYCSGQVSFDAVPYLEQTILGNLYQTTDATNPEKKNYYLPMDIEIIDTNNEYDTIFVGFGVDDGDMTTPANYKGEGWGDNTDIGVTKTVYISQGNGAFQSGWRQLDISDLLRPLYMEDIISDGDSIKYTVYGSIAGEAVALKTDSITLNFSGVNEAYGVSPTDGMMGADGQFGITIAYSNNVLEEEGVTIESFDYLSVEVEGQAYTYYIPINYVAGESQLDLVAYLSNAYMQEPTMPFNPEEPEDLGDLIGSEELTNLVGAITGTIGDDGQLAVTLNVYYHYLGSSALEHTTNAFTVYFNYSA